MKESEKQQRIDRLKSRLENAYAAEEEALKCQSTSNQEGEQSQMASLKQIRELIDDLETKINQLENQPKSATMFWGFR